MCQRLLLGPLALVAALGCTPTASSSTAQASSDALAPSAAPSPHAQAVSTASTTDPAGPSPSAAPAGSALAGDEHEGDESLVGLLGTYRIEGHVAAAVSASSEQEAKAFHGRELTVTPAIATPWEKCEQPRWTHETTKVDAWLASWNAPNLTPAQRKTLSLDGVSEVMIWRASCPSSPTPIELADPIGPQSQLVVILHDGVAYAARWRK